MSLPEIKLSNGLEFFKTSFSSNQEGGTEEIRLFIPNWKKILNSPEFHFLIFNKKEMDSAESTIRSLLVEYYQYNVLLPPKIQRKIHPYGKLTRKINMDSLLPMYEFNRYLPKIAPHKQFDKKRVWKYIKGLSEEGKINMKDKVRLDTVYNFYKNSEESISELISGAFYEYIKQFQPYSPLGYSKFKLIEIDKICKIISYFSSKPADTDFTKAEYEYIKKSLEGDSLIRELYSDSFIHQCTCKANELLNNIDWEEIISSGNPIAKSVGADEVPVGYDDTSTMSLLGKIIGRLEEINKSAIKKEKKKRILKIISDLEGYMNYPLKYRWVCLVHIKNLFADQRVAKVYLLKECEYYIRDCIRQHEKNHLRLLMQEQKLTKPEIRLYIIHNIGLKKFNYMTPLFEPPLYSFFNYCKFGVDLFINIILKKNINILGEDVDLQWYLEAQFKSYLKFYKVFIEIVRDNEREEKRKLNGFETLETSEKFSNKNEDSEEKEDSPSEENDLDKEDEVNPEIGTDYCNDEFSDQSISNPQFKLNPQEKEFVAFRIWQENFEQRNILKTVLLPEEVDLVNKLAFESLSEKDVAEIYGVSQQAISKRKKAIIDKVHKHKEFKDFLYVGLGVTLPSKRKQKIKPN